MKWIVRILDYLDQTIKSNTGVSSLSFLAVVIAVMAIIILAIVGVCMLVEVLNNHAISSSLDGYAAIITAVAGLIVSVGLPKAINNYGENKFKNKNK